MMQRTALLDPGSVDVFYLPYTDKRPSRKEITRFLEGAIPFYGHTYTTNFRTGTTSGITYVEVTVIKKKLLSSVGFGKRIYSACSLLVEHDGKTPDKEGVYRYGEDLIHTGKQPSLDRIGENSLPPGTETVTAAHLGSLIKAQTRSISLFKHRHSGTIMIALVILLTAISGFTYRQLPATRTPVKTLPPHHLPMEKRGAQAPAVIPNDNESDWKLAFSRHTACAEATGTHITRWSFNTISRRSEFSVRSDRPSEFLRALEESEKDKTVGVSTMSYDGTKALFTVVLDESKDFSTPVTAEPADTSVRRNEYASLLRAGEAVARWSRLSGLPLESIHPSEGGRYSFLLDETTIEQFLRSLAGISTHRLPFDVQSLSFMRDGSRLRAEVSGTTNTTARVTVSEGFSFPPLRTILAAFALDKRTTIASKATYPSPSVQSSDDTQVGMILEDSGRHIVFSLAANGNIMTKENQE